MHKQEYRRRLPAWALREEIVKTVRASQVVVISGETGCGKTTQVMMGVIVYRGGMIRRFTIQRNETQSQNRCRNSCSMTRCIRVRACACDVVCVCVD